MSLKVLLYIYILFVTIISFSSYKKGIYLIWLTLLLTPIIILQTGIKLGVSMMTLLMLESIVSELRFSERRTLWRSFVEGNHNIIVLYIIVSMATVFFSQSVPIGIQMHRVLDEMSILLFSLQSYLSARDNRSFSTVLFKMVCGIILFNIFYCFIFEVVIGINPAGLPLYMLLGIDDEEFLVDAIESERGAISFRAQTVYGHPLSLGQYLLAFLPLFFIKDNGKFKFLFILIICILIVLSGTRGAMAPLVVLLLLSINRWINVSLPKWILFITLALSLFFVTNRQWGNFTKVVEPYVAGFMFWDDSKQKDNDIQGSSMEMRFDQFDAALKETEDCPILGRGYGYREYWQNLHNGPHPDLLGYESLIVYYLVERGWIGLVFFFFLTCYILKVFRRSTSETGVVKLVFLGYYMSIIMTGVRPLTMLFVCLSCSIVCGQKPCIDKIVKNVQTDIIS